MSIYEHIYKQKKKGERKEDGEKFEKKGDRIRQNRENAQRLLKKYDRS